MKIKKEEEIKDGRKTTEAEKVTLTGNCAPKFLFWSPCHVGYYPKQPSVILLFVFYLILAYSVLLSLFLTSNSRGEMQKGALFENIKIASMYGLYHPRSTAWMVDIQNASFHGQIL